MLLGDVSGALPAELMRFIINVSAMEGKFSRAKTVNHPHTNMAKAALNMLVRTSARELAEGGVFLTAVDTGWVNDENPAPVAARIAAEHAWAPPLDEVDAAARILDPILAPLAAARAAGRGEADVVFGAFLKDYHASEW
jgi:NAD(P)-dependent dehydrogenase (short-subunit alcohol dehydrogenase family)